MVRVGERGFRTARGRRERENCEGDKKRRKNVEMSELLEACEYQLIQDRTLLPDCWPLGVAGLNPDEVRNVWPLLLSVNVSLLCKGPPVARCDKFMHSQ